MKTIKVYLVKEYDENNNNAYAEYKKGAKKIELFINDGELDVSPALHDYLWCESIKEDGTEVDLCIYEREDGNGVRLKYKEYEGVKVVANESFINMSYKDFYNIAEDLCDLPQTSESSKWFDNILYKGL